jgi:hypothetical protein
MADQYRITDEGIQEAIEILDRGGFLPEPLEDEALNTLQLKTSCAKYIDASRAKGDARTDQEERDVIIVFLFEAHISARVRRMLN